MDLNLEVLTRSKGKLFHYQDSQAVEKDPHRICESSILEVFRIRLDKTWHNVSLPHSALSMRMN